jgi:HEPN domain-containing protein
MLDIEKLIAFWRHGAQEDLTVAQELLERDRIRHGLFFLHLALEKLLKAHVCRQTRDLAPRVHNLVRLAELAALHLPESCKDTLAAMNPFAIAGRYPDSPFPLPTHDEARGYAERVQEVFTCLMRLLSQ